MKINTKKMIPVFIIIYLTVVVIIFLIKGGFYFTKKTKKDILLNKSISCEFKSFDRSKVVKGAYTGIIEFKGNKYYQLQFPDLLRGENRYLNIYQGIEKGINPYVFESDSQVSGKPAFIMYAFDEFGSNTSTLYYKLFKDEFYKTPQFFLDTIGESDELENDTLIVLAFDIISGSFSKEINNSIKTEIIIWIKSNNGTFTAFKNTDLMYAFENSGNCTINQTNTNKLYDNLKLIWWTVVDIVTAPIQLIIIIFYFVIVLFKGGPVK
jgi:hypothetical protein